MKKAFIRKAINGYDIVEVDEKGNHHDVDRWPKKRDCKIILNNWGWKIIKEPK